MQKVESIIYVGSETGIRKLYLVKKKTYAEKKTNEKKGR